jgi:hypothetical protein
MKIEHLSGVRILRVDLAAIFGAKDVTLYLTYARVELAPCALHLWHRLFHPSIGAKKERWPASLGSLPGALQVAAPSMKAALEAWGSEANLFHQGFAKEADDPAIISDRCRCGEVRPGIDRGCNSRLKSDSACGTDA